MTFAFVQAQCPTYDFCMSAPNSVIYKNLEIGLNTIDLNPIPGFYYYKIQNYSKEYEGKLVIK